MFTSKTLIKMHKINSHRALFEEKFETECRPLRFCFSHWTYSR